MDAQDGLRPRLNVQARAFALKKGKGCCHSCSSTLINMYLTYEPRHEKTGFLHMRKQRRRSASR